MVSYFPWKQCSTTHGPLTMFNVEQNKGSNCTETLHFYRDSPTMSTGGVSVALKTESANKSTAYIKCSQNTHG